MRSLVIPLIAAALLPAGCASKKFVSREVGQVNEKVATLSADVERTQERTKRNETRIDEVSQKADSGIAEAKGSAQQALNRATEAERAAKGKLVYSLTIANDKVTFPFDRAQLSDEAKQMVDETVAPLAADNRGVFIEIEGHSDATGPEARNQRLGQERAEAVRAYLHDQHQVALNRMEVISYGSSKPVTDNKTKAHRAENRRVVINVLE